MKRLKIYTITSFSILAVLIFFMSSFGEQEPSVTEEETEAIPVQTVPFQELAVQHNRREIYVSGRFQTNGEIHLSFMTGGVIDSILVKEGDEVAEGLRLATLDVTDINARLRQAELRLEQVRRDHERVVNLYADSVATSQDLADSETALELAREAVVSAQFNRKHAEIYATSAGFILEELAAAGETVQPGSPVLRMEIPGDEGYFLRADVSDEEWAAIEQGDTAQIEAASFPDQVLPGFVMRKSRGAGSTSNGFWIDLSFSDDIASAAVASGMFGEAVIITHRESRNEAPLYRIPYETLLDGDGNSGFVFVTDDGRHVQKVPVTVAGIRGDHVLIETEPAGRDLIVSGSAYLSENSRISVIQTQENEPVLSGTVL